MDAETMQRIEDLEITVNALREEAQRKRGSAPAGAVFDIKPVQAFGRIWERLEEPDQQPTREPVCEIRGVDYYEGDIMGSHFACPFETAKLLRADVVSDGTYRLTGLKCDTDEEVLVDWHESYVTLYARAGQ